MANLTEMKNVTVNYLKDVRSEAKKVVWPDQRYVIAATIIVLIVIFVFAGLIVAMDFGFGKLFQWLFSVKVR